MVLLQDGHELKGCKDPPNLQLGELAIKAAEDSRVIATDEEDLEALQIKGRLCQQLHRGDQDIECLRENGDGQVEFDFHDTRRLALEI